MGLPPAVRLERSHLPHVVPTPLQLLDGGPPLTCRRRLPRHAERLCCFRAPVAPRALARLELVRQIVETLFQTLVRLTSVRRWLHGLQLLRGVPQVVLKGRDVLVERRDVEVLADLRARVDQVVPQPL